MANQRALWQSFGLRPDDMTVVDYVEKLVMLQAEADAERAKRKS
jgi:hypothetical protein